MYPYLAFAIFLMSDSMICTFEHRVALLQKDRIYGKYICLLELTNRLHFLLTDKHDHFKMHSFSTFVIITREAYTMNL